jgi:hypothetical protein
MKKKHLINMREVAAMLLVDRSKPVNHYRAMKNLLKQGGMCAVEKYIAETSKKDKAILEQPAPTT